MKPTSGATRSDADSFESREERRFAGTYRRVSIPRKKWVERQQSIRVERDPNLKNRR